MLELGIKAPDFELPDQNGDCLLYTSPGFHGTFLDTHLLRGFVRTKPM